MKKIFLISVSAIIVIVFIFKTYQYNNFGKVDKEYQKKIYADNKTQQDSNNKKENESKKKEKELYKKYAKYGFSSDESSKRKIEISGNGYTRFIVDGVFYNDEDLKNGVRFGYFHIKNNDSLEPHTKYVLADESFNIITDKEYDLPIKFDGNLALVNVGFKYVEGDGGGYRPIESTGKWGFIDKSGKEIVPLKYDWVNNFNEDLASISIDLKKYHRGFHDGKWGFINKDGNVAIPLIYDDDDSDYINDTYFFKDGIVRVRKDGLWGWIDKSGNEIIPIIYSNAKPFNDEELAPVELNGKSGAINRSGEIVLPLIYDGFFTSFIDGYIAFKKDNKYGFVDKSGREISPFIYDEIEDSELYYLKEKFDNIYYFYDGLSVVRKNNKWGAIDKTGVEVIPFIYDDWFVFGKDDTAFVRLNNKGMYIDRNGNVIQK